MCTTLHVHQSIKIYIYHCKCAQNYQNTHLHQKYTNGPNFNVSKTVVVDKFSNPVVISFAFAALYLMVPQAATLRQQINVWH
jgi:hypothetical protein